MAEFNSRDEKVEAIHQYFAPLVGTTLLQYDTAELRLLNGDWVAWPDLPIRLHNDADRVVAVSWSKFDDLWLADDLTLPFQAEDAEVRWVSNAVESINAVIGQTIRTVSLGRGEMSVEGQSIEIWTRLLIQLDTQWLEIANALDENGYCVYAEHPAGVFVPCL